jgi:DNA replication protein DnaC
VPVEHPEFGQIVTCQCQRERLRDEQSVRLLRYSNLGYLTRFTFESLNPQGRAKDPDSQRMFQQALEAASEYAANPRGWLVFIGPNGSGKTHLAAAIANRRIQNGHLAFFVHVPDLLDHLRASFAPNSEVSYTELQEQVKNTPLLVLDGLSAQATSPWALEKLQQIVNHRFNAELPTVVTTASALAELDPYIRSRLQAQGLSRVIEVGRREQGPSHSLGRIAPEMLRRMTFETFNVNGNNASDSQRASLEFALHAAKNFAADPDGWLTLFGDTGVGKTHLAIAIAAERLRKGYPAFFAFVPELLDYLRYTFSPDSRIAYDRLFEEVKNAPLLILDDLGQEHSSPWADEKLYQIIVYRHNARLPTVITTMQEVLKERGPIGSRIQDTSVGQLVRLEAPDYRIKEKGGGRPVRPSAPAMARNPQRGARR